MTNHIKRLSVPLAALLMAISLFGQAPAARAQPVSTFSQPELDQMLAPIALYPDNLLSQILMAATYPLEVVEAERWTLANPGLSGVQAVQAVAGNNWDPSVKSLVAFPRILGMMSDKLDWTERLGDAFLGQEQQVMDTVQGLRSRAYQAGNLVTNEVAQVVPQDGYISVLPANPEIAYEPYYDPNVIYGPWWWPGYAPVYWAPWPGYFARPGPGLGFAWGSGIFVGIDFFFGACDWRTREVNVINVVNIYHPRNDRFARRAPLVWQHNPDHRRGVPYRAPEVNGRYSPPGSAYQPRSGFRGHDTPASAPVATSPAPAVSAPRGNPSDPRGERGREGFRPPTSPPVVPTTPAPIARQPTPGFTAPPPTIQVPPRQPHALENIGQGEAARAASIRGRMSQVQTQPAQAPRQSSPPPAQPRPAPQPHPAPSAPALHEGHRDGK